MAVARHVVGTGLILPATAGFPIFPLGPNPHNAMEEATK